MPILKLIKNRTTTRYYKNSPISLNKLDKIINAGIWGPSIHHLQPWMFIILKNKAKIKKIAQIVLKKSKTLPPGYNILMRMTSETISNSTYMVFIYNTAAVQQRMSKFGPEYKALAEFSEIQSIAACIQNMVLTAEELKVGTAWLVIPKLCTKDINKVLNTKFDFVACLSIGQAAQKGKRSVRKPKEETIKYIA